MKEVSRAGRCGVLLLLAAVAFSCSSGATGAFTLNGASVDSPYACPSTANDAPYNLHGTIEVHNGTSSTVMIMSVSAELTLAASRGTWLEKVGDRYDASTVKFSPETVPAGSSASIQVAIGSACTSGKSAKIDSSWGDYSVQFWVIASSGTYRIASENRHRILAG